MQGVKRVPKNKLGKLHDFILEHGKNGVMIAFSGGVDSSTLSAICFNVLKEKAIAVTAVSPTYPLEEIEDAKKIARSIGIQHILIETNELANEDFVRNPEDRCYFCKKELITHLIQLAKNLKFETIFEGTNLSDLRGHRPGYNAVKEMKHVYSPWVENQFSKKEIRVLAKKLKLPISNKPSLACLASRLCYGEPITSERLKRVEEAEHIIRKIIGVQQLRVRDHNEIARIEIGKDERHFLFNISYIDKIAYELKKLGFQYVTFDLEGYRTGSMLRTLPSE